jgi:WD40 repeat protein
MSALAGESYDQSVGVELASPLFDVVTVDAPANANAAAFGNEDHAFAVALGDGSVVIGSWAADGGEPVLTRHPRHGVAAVAVRPFRAGFVSAGQDGTVYLTEAAAPHEATKLWASAGDWIEALAVHEREGRIAAASARTVIVLNAAGDVIFERAFDETIADVTFDADGRRLAIAHYGGVSLIELAGGTIEHRFDWKGAHIGVTWSPDHRYVVSATQEKELHIWDLVTMRDFRMGGYPRKTHQMDWTADGQMLACSGADVVTAWPFKGSGPEGRPPVEIGFVFGATVTAVAAHPTRNLIAAGFSSGSVLVGATAKGEALIARSRTGHPVISVAFAPDGRRLIAVDRSGGIALIAMPEQLGVR